MVALITSPRNPSHREPRRLYPAFTKPWEPDSGPRGGHYSRIKPAVAAELGSGFLSAGYPPGTPPQSAHYSPGGPWPGTVLGTYFLARLVRPRRALLWLERILSPAHYRSGRPSGDCRLPTSPPSTGGSFSDLGTTSDRGNCYL
jgi:hypothetical protein